MDALSTARTNAESAALRAALVAARGSRTEAARALGVSRDAVNRALDRHPDVAADFPATRGRRPGARDGVIRKRRSDAGIPRRKGNRAEKG